MSSKKGSLTIGANLSATVIYTKYVSDSRDTVGDKRLLEGVAQECTGDSDIKGGGEWAPVASSASSSVALQISMRRR